MLAVITKALAFVIIILIGYRLKKSGFFAQDDYRLISKIVMNITLPGAIISSFAHFKMDYSLFVLAALGIVTNALMVGVALLLTRRETPAAKIFYVFGMSGYNIGNFTLPFVQSFLGPFGVIALCMFDLGNSIMCTGLTYALTASVVGTADGRREPVSVRGIIDKLAHSAPFLVYIVLVTLILLKISLPAQLYDFAAILGSANTFLSMLMIGMMFELNLNKRNIAYIREIVCSRYVAGFTAAFILLYFRPFAHEANVVAAAALMAPSTAIGPIFIEKMGGNAALAGVVNSLTIMCSVVIFVLFFTMLHI